MVKATDASQQILIAAAGFTPSLKIIDNKD
jgi:hypothetical protein